MAKIDWNDPEARRAYDREKAYHKYHNDPEFRQKRLDRAREKYSSDPAYRKMVIKSNKKAESKRYNFNIRKAFDYVGKFGCMNPDCKHNPEFFHHIDWHHQIPENKTDKMSKILRKNTWDKVKAEIDKADVIPLCTFCHRDMHTTESPQPLNTPEELE